MFTGFESQDVDLGYIVHIEHRQKIKKKTINISKSGQLDVLDPVRQNFKK